MASAKQCDRCGEFYKVNTLPKVATFILYEYRAFQYNGIDICPNCLHSLKEWLESPLKDREDNV